MGTPGNEFQSRGAQAFSDAAWVKTLLDAVSDHAIYMLSPEGKIASWNHGAAELTGYDEAEVLGRDFSHLFPAEDKALPAKLLDEARSRGRAERDVRQLRKDGTHFSASVVLHPARDPDGNLVGFAQVTRDIADRLAAEHALSDSERRFRLLVEGVTDYAIYMLDPSGTITSWNAGAERLKGYKAEEIVGHHFSRFYTKEDRDKGLPTRALETAMREGSFQAEGWRVRKDGSRFWASVVVDAIRDAEGRLIGFAKISRDVSERRAAQEALRSSERQFRLLVDGIRDYAVYMLDPSGVVSSWNAGAQRIKGYSAEEIIGHHFSRFYTENDRAAGAPVRTLVTAASEGRFEAEGWRVRKDGSSFWASVVVDRIQDENGKLLGFAKITRDITERREAQLALQEAQAQRMQAQKMEALGHLTGGVAHDFNNLLMIIGGQNHVVKRLTTDLPRCQRAAEAIEMAITRGAALTRQLLAFSRRQTLRPSAIDLGVQIANFTTMLTGTMGGMTVSAEVPADIWPVLADPNELELALLNLAINARDAMPGGGTILLGAENATLTGGELPAKLTGDFVAITVADTGTGIAPDILPKIFDPFFTTKQVNKGTGLGLSQVHGFAHQSGGTVAIDTRLGEGTRITLYLPRALAGMAEETEKSDQDKGGGGEILLVEDNPEVAEASCAMLEELGYRCEIAPDAAVAMEALTNRDFDLALVDIVMPGPVDGSQLARKVRAMKPGLPVLLVSGYPKNMGDSDFPLLRKPYNLTELGRAIRTALARGDHGNVVRLKPR
jgi:PAS domain S-box-containing protein